MEELELLKKKLEEAEKRAEKAEQQVEEEKKRADAAEDRVISNLLSLASQFSSSSKIEEIFRFPLKVLNFLGIKMWSCLA